MTELTGILDLGTGLGLETLQRRVATILHDEVNAMLATIAAEKATEDTDFYSYMGIAAPTITVEDIVKFHTGHRPSLIEAPVTEYPNISVYAYSGAPQVSSDDHGTIYQQRLSVEIMVKALPGDQSGDNFSREWQEAEELINIRIQRTSDAVLRVMRAHAHDPDLDLGDTPTVNLGDIFVRREKDAAGDRWLWQGARHDYTIGKFVGF